MDLLVHVLAHFLFRILTRWVLAHQDNRLARFLLKHRGPRQDVAWMTRPERFRSAWTFLLYGIASGALLAVTIYGWSELGLHDNGVVYMCIVWFLMIFTLMGLGGGIYLFVRGLACGMSQAIRRRRR
jgi:peptidoglycan/LPS O-acetylase OafA/YrhL